MKTSMTTIIDAPPAVVFLWLEDNDRIKKWVPNLIEDEAITETPDKVGSRFRQVFLEGGKEMEMIGEITAYTENERIRIDMTGKMFDLDVDYILKALSDTQTELTQDTEIKMKGFMKIMTPIMFLMSKFSSKNPQADAHATLKTMAEAEFQGA